MFVTTVCLFAVSGNAQQQHATFQYGDIIAGGQTVGGFGRFDWYLPDGTLNKRMAETRFGELPGDVALDAATNAYWPTFYAMRVFNNRGDYVGSFPRFSASFFALMVFDRVGNAYTNAPAVPATGNLAQTTSAGDLIRTYALPVGNFPNDVINSIDLAADQCTIYYTTTGKRILRYDVCRDAALSDLTSSLPGISAEHLRILPDGGVLVAMVDRVVRISNTGSQVQTYDLPGEQEWARICLNVDGTSFWATSFENAYRIDLATGTVLASFRSSDYWFRAITVVGEPRAATGSSSPAIPVLSEWLLVLIMCTLCAVGLVRLKTW